MHLIRVFSSTKSCNECRLANRGMIKALMRPRRKKYFERLIDFRPVVVPVDYTSKPKEIEELELPPTYISEWGEIVIPLP